MKKLWKWSSIVGAVIVAISVVGAAKLYYDVQQTTTAMYTPIQSTKKVATQQMSKHKEELAPFAALFIGVDALGDSGRSDTLIVATVNPKQQTTKLLSIPRDTYTAIAGKSFSDKINHSYAFGGLEMTLATVEQLLNIPINYVVTVNMESFITLIDLVGGIKLQNEFAFYYDGVYFPTGEVSLNGEETLKYVRMRYDDPAGDFGRQHRQRLVVEQLLKESTSVSNIFSYNKILNQLTNNVQMNMTLEDITYVLQHYRESLQSTEKLQFEHIESMFKNDIYYTVIPEHEIQQMSERLRQHLQLIEDN